MLIAFTSSRQLVGHCVRSTRTVRRPLQHNKQTTYFFSSCPSGLCSTTTSTRHILLSYATGAIAVITFASLATPQYTSSAARVPATGDIVNMGAPTKEKATGILFPALCNGFSLVGTGVRIKYIFVKVYAVGTYMDPIAMMAVKNGSPAVIEKALLDPTYPRTIRIVMNRSLSIEKFTAAIVESLEPRMKGKDLDKLEEFKKLNPPVDLIEGAEIEMTIRGDTLLFKNATGGVGSVRSEVFTRAMCDVYYGADPVSPDHKASVMEGIPKL